MLSVALLTASILEAQQPKDSAPIPAQIAAARKVFISNAGQDGMGGFSGDPDRAYNQLYSTLRSWGHYDLVSTPADADLVFEVSFDVQAIGTSVVKGDTVGTGYAPRFRLRILDPKTHFTLWTFSEHINWARLAANRDKDFDQGLTVLVGDLKKLASRSASAGETAAK